MLAVVNASEEDFDKLTSAVDNADGTAKKMADTLQDNLQGQFTILKSSLEGLGIQIYDEIKEPLRDTAEDAITSVGKISKAFTDNGVNGAASALGDIVANAVSDIASSATQMSDVAFDFIDGFCSGISNNLSQISISAKLIVRSLIDGVINLLPSMVDSASEMIGVAAVCIDRFIDGIRRNAHKIGNAAKEIVEALVDGIVTLLPKELEEPIKKTMATIERSFDNGGIKKALDSFKTALKKVGGAATNIVSKFLNPLATAVDKLAGNVDKIVPL